MVMEKTGKESNLRGQSFMLNLLSSFTLFILFILLILSLYVIYINIPGEPEYLNVNIKIPTDIETQSLSNTQQFYHNMKFNHNEISYRVNNDCSEEQSKRMELAFKELSGMVGEITFYSTGFSPDIEVSCTNEINYNGYDMEENIEKNYFIAGEGGAKEIVETGRYYIITNGIIFLYEGNKKWIKCPHPNIEMHELLHVFGFDHLDDKKSLMYPYLTSCDQTLDDSIINELKKLYSEDNLPELYFENFTSIKKGRYLDFNFTVKNSGSVNSDNIILTIMEDYDILEVRDLGVINFGAGVFMQTTNLRLNKRNPNQIRFIIDKENDIEEINEANNFAIISL